MRRQITALVIALLLPAGLWAARTETRSESNSGQGTGTIDYEDTSAANTAITLTTTAKTYARTLRSIQAVCSASATVTVTSKITRTITSGAVDILLPDISISASTSGGQYVEIPLLPADVVAVTVPAAGAGITCSPMVIEATK